MTKKAVRRPSTSLSAPPPPPAPAPSSAPVKRPRNPFLTVNDVNRQGITRLQLTGVMRLFSGDRGVSLICEVRIGSTKGPLRDYSLMIGKRSFIAAKIALGDDIGQWSGQILSVEVDQTGQYVNVHEDEHANTASSTPAPVSDDDIPF